jgi:hypothetical protein
VKAVPAVRRLGPDPATATATIVRGRRRSRAKAAIGATDLAEATMRGTEVHHRATLRRGTNDGTMQIDPARIAAVRIATDRPATWIRASTTRKIAHDGTARRRRTRDAAGPHARAADVAAMFRRKTAPHLCRATAHATTPDDPPISARSISRTSADQNVPRLPNPVSSSHGRAERATG